MAPPCDHHHHHAAGGAWPMQLLVCLALLCSSKSPSFGTSRTAIETTQKTYVFILCVCIYNYICLYGFLRGVFNGACFRKESSLHLVLVFMRCRETIHQETEPTIVEQQWSQYVLAWCSQSSASLFETAFFSRSDTLTACAALLECAICLLHNTARVTVQ